MVDSYELIKLGFTIGDVRMDFVDSPDCECGYKQLVVIIT